MTAAACLCLCAALAAFAHGGANAQEEPTPQLDPFWESALLTGLLGDNAAFTDWEDGLPVAWESSAPDRIRQDPEGHDGQPCLTIRPGSNDFVDMYQRHWDPPFREGDLLTLSVDAWASEPGTLDLRIRIDYADGDRDIITLAHPGDKQWHTLRAAQPVSKSQIRKVDFGVRVLLRSSASEARLTRALPAFAPPIP